ncbi:MAG: hypothetical protein R6X19_06790 [Kiritimatiellia bacterium]
MEALFGKMRLERENVANAKPPHREEAEVVHQAYASALARQNSRYPRNMRRLFHPFHPKQREDVFLKRTRRF